MRASVEIFDLGLSVAFTPLHFPIFKASLKYLAGASCLLIKKIGFGGGKEYHIKK